MDNYTTKLMEKSEIKALPQNVQERLKAFMESIHKTNWYRPDGKPKKEWKVVYGNTWASAEASARAFAWASARDSARDSARASTWAFAWASARDSAWDSAASAWASARDSAWDFSLKACQIIISDIDYSNKKKHEEHIDSRIEVWRKGYGLLCDIDGVLYVYARSDKMTTQEEREELKDNAYAKYKKKQQLA